jgi:hypothetical protein
MNFRRIAENLIEEAVKNGEFDNLPGAGKPLPPLPEGDPFDVMMAQIMKRNGATPLEVQLKRSIADKAKAIQEMTDPKKKAAELQELSELRLRLNVALEGRRRQP